MGNILTYVKEKGHLAFDEFGFNEVDSLIFSELAYLRFDCCTGQPTPFGLTLSELLTLGFCSEIPLSDSHRNRDAQLFREVAASRRFGGVGIDLYRSETDDEQEKQFAAVTFRLSTRLHYLAFRGTDGTITGWKENFNLSFMEDVPAQRAACEYFEGLCEKLRSNWILGGHSKGGNLAVYAALSAKEKYQRTIAMIYSHDGPGFSEEVLARPGYAAIAKRIHKTIPESAVVGLLLSDPTECAVIKSTSQGVMQHYVFTWEIENGRMARSEDTDRFSKTTDRTVRRWIRDLSPENRKLFIDALCRLFRSTGATTVREASSVLGRNLPMIYSELMELPPDARKVLLETIRELAVASGESMLLSVGEQAMQSGEQILNAPLLNKQIVKDGGAILQESGKQLLKKGKRLGNSLLGQLNKWINGNE